MRSIHDFLRDSQEHLPETVRAVLAPLFDREDLLSMLASSLLVLARQGPPAEPPPPRFAVETTPSLADAFAPFRHALAAWHDQPDRPGIAVLLADALADAGLD